MQLHIWNSGSRSLLVSTAVLIFANHSLDVPERVQYKLSVLIYSCLHGLSRQYLADPTSQHGSIFDPGTIFQQAGQGQKSSFNMQHDNVEFYKRHKQFLTSAPKISADPPLTWPFRAPVDTVDGHQLYILPGACCPTSHETPNCRWENERRTKQKSLCQCQSVNIYSASSVKPHSTNLLGAQVLCEQKYL